MKLQTRYRFRSAAALAIFLTAFIGFGSIAAAGSDDRGGHGNGKSEAAHDREAPGQQKKEDPADEGSEAGAGEGSGGKFECDSTHHSDTGHGANTDGPDNPYHNTCEPEHEPGNGAGDGKATGQPCAGCVGNADDKNPPGQAPGGSDHNKGYECDENQGVGKENPAHTGCETTAPPPPPDEPKCPDGSAMPTTDVNGDDVINADDCNDKPKPPKPPKPPSPQDTPDEPSPPEPPRCPNGAAMPGNDVNGDGVVNARDCNPLCPNGSAMPNFDVNGDGVINLGDCNPRASVLGVTIARSARPTEVLGTQILAFTGAGGIIGLAQLGLGLSLAGSAMSLAAMRMRRRSR